MDTTVEKRHIYISDETFCALSDKHMQLLHSHGFLGYIVQSKKQVADYEEEEPLFSESSGDDIF